MKGGKDEGKVTSPMFPRLHVNDTDKGGPRPPPRNKMALYEQLSIPSQRLGSGSPSMFPIPSSNGSTLAPSMSSSNGGGQERSVYTQFCNFPAAPLLAEKLHSYSLIGVKLNAMMTNQEWNSMMPANYQSFNATGPLSSTATSYSSKPSNFSNFRNFSMKKLGDENGLRVPTSARLGVGQQSSSSQHSKDPKYKLKKGSGPGDLRSRPYAKNQTEESAKVSQTSQEPEGRSTSIPFRERNLINTSSSPSPNVKHSESLKRANSSLSQENRSSSVDILNSLQSNNARLHLESEAPRDEIALGGSDLMESAKDMDKANAFKLISKACLRPSLGDDNINPNVLVKGRTFQEDKNDRSIQVREVELHDDVSNSSMVNSVSALALSPDDVVGVIGDRHFWKARRALINQQRVFAVQVFELHRLMKVQRLLARSPRLLIEGSFFIDKPPLNVSQVKRLQSEYSLEPSSHVVRAKRHSKKPHLSTECEDENAVASLPHPSVKNDASKGLVTQHSNYGSDSENAPPAPAVRNIKPSPWCFPPPANQWLVSVMSPPEGLVYKPYMGPCPPTAGFVAPFYGSCGPVSLTPAGGDFLNTAYGVPASHQQGIGILPGTPALAQIYLPPYGMPVMNSSISDSVEQMSPFPGVRSKDNHLSMVDISFMIPHQSSCNMSSQMSQVISRCLGKVQASKESEVQGRTACSPSERAEGDELSLFPMEPILKASERIPQTSEQQTRVIKVVPHNRRLATESAARIFQSIQQERKQYD